MLRRTPRAFRSCGMRTLWRFLAVTDRFRGLGQRAGWARSVRRQPIIGRPGFSSSRGWSGDAMRLSAVPAVLAPGEQCGSAFWRLWRGPQDLAWRRFAWLRHPRRLRRLWEVLCRAVFLTLPGA